jgi:hypothetical protein
MYTTNDIKDLLLDPVLPTINAAGLHCMGGYARITDATVVLGARDVISLENGESRIIVGILLDPECGEVSVDEESRLIWLRGRNRMLEFNSISLYWNEESWSEVLKLLSQEVPA